MRDFKLANVLLRVDGHVSAFPELYYRASGAVDYSDEDASLGFEGSVEFTTYFNALSWGKWVRYAELDNAFLHIETVGDGCTIQLVAIRSEDVSVSDAPSRKYTGSISAVRATPRLINITSPVRIAPSADYVATDIPVPSGNFVLVGFKITSDGASAMRDTYWHTCVPSDRVRPIKLALATTTFKKEEYIEANVRAIKEGIIAADDPISNAFHMFVVDNGRTLDADAITDDGVTVIPNANVGGAGGFACGMIATLEGEGFTHVLLMDDDVKVSLESFKRTFNLLSLASDAYKGAFVNGAMLALETPNMLYEDVAFVAKSGTYDRIKGNLFADILADVAVNEAIDVEIPQAYGAWWYSCMPLDAVRAHGLPLPIFVRCDDVEYGMRCAPTYMTMNGICVWHEGFTGRHRASIDGYQYIRNYMIMTACDGKSDANLFVMRINRTLRLYARMMAYETMDLMISGFEDYMRGPEFIMNVDGEKLLVSNNAKGERFIPLQDAIADAVSEHPELEGSLNSFQPDMNVLTHENSPIVRRALGLFRTLPYDKHMLSDSMLRGTPATAYHGYATVPSYAQVGTKVIVACDREGKNAHVRVMDKDRYRQLMSRWHAIEADYRKRGKEVAQAYKDAMPEMTGVEFWKDYLRRANEGRLS